MYDLWRDPCGDPFFMSVEWAEMDALWLIECLHIIDKKRMENGAFIDEDYFEHLLSEIREIRMSERRFYQKLKDIYATSIDYNRDAPTTRMFYKKMQNKMHFAVQGLMPLY